MQQMQLWIFWAIVAAWVVCACILNAETKKKAINGNRAARKKGAVIGRAAGEPYRSLKKLNQKEAKPSL
jgi:hypothetical protein